MPIYRYKCDSCSTEFVKFMKSSQDILPKFDCCPMPLVKKIMSSTSFALKGGGWYKDGYSSSVPKNTGENAKSTA